MATYSYITRISTPEIMAVTMAVLECSVELGILAGILISGPLADTFGLDSLAYINVGLAFIPVILVMTFVKEIPRENKAAWRDVVGVRHIFDAIVCVFKARPRYSRLRINLCFVCTYSLSIAAAGYAAVSYLYFVKEEGMTMTQLSVFTAFLMFVKGVGGPVILGLAKRFLHVALPTMATVSCGVLVCGYAIMSINSIPYSIWIGGTLLMFQSVVLALVRSFQVTLVEKDEVGKLFAYDGIVQVVFSLATMMFFKELYSATLLFWPGLFLAFCAFLNIISMLVIVVIFKISPRTNEDAENRVLLQDS